MLGVKDPRLLSLLHYVHHEHLRRVLELVNREGSGLLLCLQGESCELCELMCCCVVVLLYKLCCCCEYVNSLQPVLLW